MSTQPADPTPPQPKDQGHPILDRPATVADCARDYAAGAAERGSSEKRDDAHRR